MAHSFQIAGPIPKWLRNRFRRRVRETAAAAVVVVVLLTNLDLSGQWVGSGEIAEINALWNVRLYHVGNRLRGYTPDGQLRLAGYFGQDDRFFGTVFLRRTGGDDGTPAFDCAPGQSPLEITKDVRVGEVDLLIAYSGRRHDDTCNITERPRHTIRLVRSDT